MPLVTFADASKMQIQVEVPSNLLGMITKGAKINARLDGSKELFPAVVERIFPSADMGGHTTTVKFDLLDASKARSGMYVEVMIPDPNKTNRSLPVIPESAIVWTTSLPGVFILDEQGNPKLRLIRIGERTADGKVSIISGGIKAGDQILAKPQAGFQPGA